jgi:hypothetical protein
MMVVQGCVDPRSERRLNASNVGGDWIEAGPPSPLRVSIVSQGSLNDLLVEVRGRPIGDDERAVIDRLVDAAAAADLLSVVVLGADVDAVLVESVGGENVSFDGGAITTVNVSGPPFALVDSVGAGAAPGVARYSLFLEGDEQALRGVFTLGIDERVKHLTDVDGEQQQATILRTPLRLVRGRGADDGADAPPG